VHAARTTSVRLTRSTRILPFRGAPPRFVLAAVAVLAVAALGWVWVRDSSLVAVDDVTITGVSGPDASRVRSMLDDAARDMTTLHVSAAELRNAVAAYPQVKDVHVTTHFPHGLDISVVEHNPVAVIVADGKRIPVAEDGKLLRSVAPGDIATVEMTSVPGGDRLTDRRASQAVELLAAAPVALREKVVHVWTGERGLSARLDDGPLLYFGTTERLDAKWTAVARVLEAPEAAGALYLDVRVPERTAAGGLAEPATGQPSTGG
jgi:cell division protein FtsQ